MKTPVVALPLLLAAPLFAQPEEILDSRDGWILIDGIVDEEWERHEAHLIDEETGLLWRGTYDNSYYYFLLESEDPNSLTSARIYLYGDDWCEGFSEYPPEHKFLVTWTSEQGLKAQRAGAAENWEATSAELVYASAHESGSALELAIPGSWIGSQLGAGGDVNWTMPIRMMIGARNGSSYRFWDDAFEQSSDLLECTYGRLEFSGWPGNAIEVDPGTAHAPINGNDFIATVNFADPDAPLEVESNPDWISVELEERALEVTVAANTGANRVGYIELRGPEETVYGSLRVEQAGLHGSPWDLDFRDPVTGYIYSWMDGIYIPGLTYEDAPPTSGVMWSYDHGWMTYVGNDASSVFLYDFEMGLWWWTSEGNFPYVFIWDEAPNWFWYDYAGPQNRPRTFYDFQTGEWRVGSEIGGE